MATAKKLPSGNYRVRVFVGKVNGKPEYKSFTSYSKTQAEYDAANFLLNLNNKKKKPEDLTVGDAIDKYIESKDSVLSPSTSRVYRRYRLLYLQPLMDIKISNVSQDDIQLAVNKDTKLHSPKTIRNAHGLLSVALGECLPDFRIKTKLPQRIKHEMKIPNDDNIKEMMQDVEGQYLELAIILGGLLGMRRSEMCAMDRSDVDPKSKEIRINKAVVLSDKASLTKENKKGTTWVEKTTKTYTSTRTLTNVSPEIIDRILELAPDSGRVLPYKPNTITKSFIKLRNKHGFSFRLHDLRHYYASVMLALGIPDKYAMKQMGHATTHMLKTVYQHVMSEKEKEATDKIGNHMGELIRHGK